MKKFLRAGWRTPNGIVYGEFGRFAVHLNSHTKCIRYLLEKTRMENSRLISQAYKMLYNLDCKGKRTWASKGRQRVSMYGFSHVWENPGVVCISGFLQCFNQANGP